MFVELLQKISTLRILAKKVCSSCVEECDVCYGKDCIFFDIFEFIKNIYEDSLVIEKDLMEEN